MSSSYTQAEEAIELKPKRQVPFSKAGTKMINLLYELIFYL